MTLYRIGTDSPIVDLLVEAAEAGKQVAVLVELKARFDERNNIKWATRLEAAGAHVAYGLLNLKTHAKLCLVVRKEADGIRRYAHLGTGNYNAQTARAYTDLGLFTSHPAIVEDVSDLFNYLTGYSNRRDYRELLVAPLSLRAAYRRADRARDRGGAGRARGADDHQDQRADRRRDHPAALPRVTGRGRHRPDRPRASAACGRASPGVSDTITVRSIVGRFLEHSRIFWFHNGGRARVFIGSADLMERNLDRRVEVLCPIHDRELADHLRDVVLAALLGDVTRAYLLAPTAPTSPRTVVSTATSRRSTPRASCWTGTRPRGSVLRLLAREALGGGLQRHAAGSPVRRRSYAHRRASAYAGASAAGSAPADAASSRARSQSPAS